MRSHWELNRFYPFQETDSARFWQSFINTEKFNDLIDAGYGLLYGKNRSYPIWKWQVD